MRRVIIMGAAGRDFHDFATVFRDDPFVRVVAFTAAQIPGIDARRFPAELAGHHYPDGIPVHPEADLERLVADLDVDEVVFSYSDLSHEEVMHRASRVLATGAGFRLVGPRASMLTSHRPVVAVTAVRTGAGKSPTSRRIGTLLTEQGFRVVLIRHPMPYGDLARMRVQRFASLADIDAADPTIEEREEYEPAVRAGLTVYAGVDYASILHHAEAEADVILWDGGNNDLPFVRPDVHVVVVDPLRPGHELTHHPGEANLRMADIIVVNKVDVALLDDVQQVVRNVNEVNPTATIVEAASPVTLDDGPSLAGATVLVVEDGPTLTHGGMAYGAGTVAARQAGVAQILDPRPYAVGSIADTYGTWPTIGAVLPAMGYGDAQVRDLEATIRASGCDAVVSGTPSDLGRLIDPGCPVRQAGYEVREIGSPTLLDALTPFLAKWR